MKANTLLPPARLDVPLALLEPIVAMGTRQRRVSPAVRESSAPPRQHRALLVLLVSNQTDLTFALLAALVRKQALVA